MPRFGMYFQHATFEDIHFCLLDILGVLKLFQVRFDTLRFDEICRQEVMNRLLEAGYNVA